MTPLLQALVVDDSPAMREVVVTILAKMGHFKIMEASNGLEALKKTRQQTFDLIVTDLNMPTMDGLKLTEMVRRDPTHAQVPIIVVTSENATRDRSRAISLGASAYLLKPVDPPQLQQTVAQLLNIDRP